MTMVTYAIVASVRVPVTRQWIAAITRAYQREYPRSRGHHVNYAFVGDTRMRRLNAQYRHKDAVTDVLSFAEGDGGFVDPSEPVSLGDIIICVPQARRQAKRYMHSLKAEITRLLVHGLVHLSGYDHERVSRRQATDFFARERRIMRHLPIALAVEHVVDDHVEPLNGR